MRLVGAFAAALAMACGSKQQDSAAVKCAGAAQQAVDSMVKRAKERIATSQLPDDVREKMDERTKKLEELAPRLRAVITNRCVDDKWKADVIRCYAQVTTMEDMRKCRSMLPPEHEAKLQREELDQMSVVTAGPHGPPGMNPGAVPARTPEIEKLETELRELNAKLNDAAKKLAAAQNDAERAAAKSDVDTLQNQMRDINDRLATARAQARSPVAPSASPTSPPPSPSP